MNLEDVHLLGTRAAQPLAADVYAGTLYYVTDESVLEIRDATVAWVPYSPSSAGISELTGDITAGPGAGSQVATIAANAITTTKILNDAITTAKILDAQITELKLLLADNVTHDVSITKHGFAPKAPNDATKYLNGVGAWAVPAGGGGSSEWDVETTKSGDQDVTNSSTLVDATDLVIPVLANEVWIWEALLLYSAEAVNADLKVALTVSAGTVEGGMQHMGLSNTDVISTAPLGWSGTTSSTATWGTTAVLANVRGGRLRGIGRFTANADFKVQFAQATAVPAVITRLKAGSIFRGKKLI